MSTSPSAGEPAGRRGADVAASQRSDLRAEQTLEETASQAGAAGCEARPPDDVAELRQEIEHAAAG